MPTDPNLTLLLGGIGGLLLGSFLNVVVSRLPVMLEKQWDEECRLLLDLIPRERPETFNLFYPRSLCTHCRKSILSIDNIPLASYVLLKGRCRNCNAQISLRYPLVEAITAFITLACLINSIPLLPGAHWSSLLESIVWLCFSSFLIVLAAIDLEKQILPDILTLLLMWLGITASALGLIALPLFDSVLGAVVGYSFFWVVGTFYKLIQKREGLARGDAKFLAALGAWLGWSELPFLVTVSSLTGAIIMGAIIFSKRMDKSEPIPFGPFLAFGGFFIVFIENNLFTQRLFAHVF